MKKSKQKKINKIIESLIYITGYSLVIITVSMIFNDSVYIDNSYYGLWAFLVSLILYILNKTVRPLLFWLTLPITALTLGLFYPFINIFLLKIIDLILGKHFNITNNIFILLLIAILISILRSIMKNIIKNIVGDKNE